ncbi:class I SAM-dependent methyltransferase [Streptomyces sp. HU2014]|uniref:Putative O-methyltransferase n=1 Tax=Streptomyces albireticuli TaxID=1940 RepID=A0A1Z2KZ24_9ACTN|nr:MULTISPECIES: class I SAM-dependent methyltransferase [Streptomyces]ARZ67307.1 putative O-methyltransferase [Streptomyces albireticuli]UQI47354.1 class I SAM-dependent methyltransferase [Streptomyces sp. HU2014]
MADQTALSPALLEYARSVSLRDDALLRELYELTARLPGGRAMQIMPEEAQFLALLVRLTGARRVLEIGTFTGYSTLCVARALPPGGRLVTCDISDKWPGVGAPFWERAGVAGRIELRVGDAVETLAGLRAAGGDGTFDLVFVDADKTGYPHYYEESLALLRPGGLVAVDNTLFFGRVADPECQDPDTEAVRALNERLRDDARVDISLLTVADGVTLARKRE